MKTFSKFLAITAAVIITSCTGPMGPPGYDGLDGIDGKDGTSFLGSIFEIQGDFTSQNDWKLYFQFPSSFEIYDTDIVLVYILWEQADGVDVWRLLPQTVVLNEGILQYNFDYTVNDVQVFLEGTVPFDQLLPAEWKDQVFRIAVLPADFAALKSVDVSDFNSIIQSPKLKIDKLEKFNLNNLNNNITFTK